ncbi:MAG: hypothetical protein Ct9H300mP32_3510 [Verrucomicrobiota bacterium]|nr:MAG: hypothetical protein Ct9H300mP32_3510 [Verrucomicrobiota bacterium]
MPIRLGDGLRLSRGFLLLEPFLNLFPASLGEEVFGIDDLEPVVAGELLRPLVGEKGCGDFSITARAARMGFFTVVTPPTAPACSARPSIIDASSSFLPSAVKTAPLPALNTGASSIMTMAASTASSALPPCLRIVCPARSDCSSVAWYSRSCSGVSTSRSIVRRHRERRWQWAWLVGHSNEKQQGGGDGFHHGPAWPSAARLATRGFTGCAFCR